MLSLARRRLLQLVGAAFAEGCAVNPREPDPTYTRKAICDVSGSGVGLNYCLVEKRELRVPLAKQLAAGQVLLVNFDDNSAAIVARDEKGFYALSAICTHSCCIVAVCGNDLCTKLETNPGDCAFTPTSALIIGQGNAAFLCPCHGSSFSSDGTALGGPALKTGPLPALAMRLDAEDVIVDLSTSVAPSARVT
jgi:Rieske Fe-S protein